MPLIDIAGERAVLSALARFGSTFKLEIDDIVDDDCFSKDLNKIIFKCFNEILNKSSKVDVPSLLSISNQLGFDKLFEKSDNLSFVKSLFEYPILQENACVLARRLKKLYIARQSQAKLKEAWEKVGELTGDESVEEIFSRVEKPITEFTTELNSGLTNQPKLLFEDAEAYANFLSDNPVSQIGFSSPWKSFDGMIGGGFRKKSISTICSRTSIGKSHVLKEIGLHSAKNGIKCLFLDTEMSIESTLHRSLASLSQTTINDIECGRFGQNSEAKARVIETARQNKHLPIYYHSIAGKDFEEVMSLCKRFVIKEVGKNKEGEYNDCLIILDYIKLMNTSALANMQEYQLFGEYLHKLHDFSVRFNLPIVTAIQTNRSGISTKDDLSTLSISDRISWLCSNMILMRELSIEEQEEIGYKGNMKFAPMKTRFGSNLSGDDWLLFKREAQYSQFKEIGKYSDLKDTSEGLEDDGEPTEF